MLGAGHLREQAPSSPLADAELPAKLCSADIRRLLHYDRGLTGLAYRLTDRVVAVLMAGP
jgi:hypothetical protein